MTTLLRATRCLNVSNSSSSHIIVIAAAQRSGSSELGKKIGEQHGCTENYNEFFYRDSEIDEKLDKQTKGAKVDVGEEMFSERWDHALASLSTGREQACKRIDEERVKAGKERCGDRCAVVIKLFKHHQVPEHQMIDLLAHKKTAVVILERDVLHRFCSLQHAHEEHDWSTKPSPNHHVECVPCAPKTDCEKEYQSLAVEHRTWYAFLRETMLATGQISLDVPFQVWIEGTQGRTEAVAQAVWGMAGLGPPDIDL